MLVRRLAVATLACIGLLLSGTANARSACPTHYLGGAEPTVPASQAQKTRELCYTAFALLHSGLSRTALWSAEKLTRQSVIKARQTERTAEFFPETRLPKSERSELADYKRSGYDRGHLVPSGNMPTPKSQQQSFSLANIIPQAATLNRHSWASLENRVRNAAYTNGTAYVVTGPLFSGAKLEALRGRVLIPTHVWKAVHIPKLGSAVYVATNTVNSQTAVMSVSEFTRRYALDPFPALSPGERSRLLKLP